MSNCAFLSSHIIIDMKANMFVGNISNINSLRAREHTNCVARIQQYKPEIEISDTVFARGELGAIALRDQLLNICMQSWRSFEKWN